MTNVYEWAGGSGAFTNPLKWRLSTNNSVHAVPGTSDDADFAAGGTVSGNGTVNQITIEAKVTFLGEISAFDQAAGIIVTGGLTLGGSGTINASDIVTGDATLLFQAGSLLNVGEGANGINAGAIGLSVGGGSATFEGARVSSKGLIAIGNSVNGVKNSGVATVLAEDGSKITASYTGLGGTGGFSSTASNRGTLTLTGKGTTWSNNATSGEGAPGSMLVGVVGTGVLKIEAGASMKDAGYADLGLASTASGTATLTGAGSSWTNVGAVYVGDAGHGVLIVENDGLLQSGGGDIGNQSGSVGAATVETGAAWQDTLWLDVGYSATGTLTIESAGAVNVGADVNRASSAAVFIGAESGSKGTVTVTGAHSKLDSDGQAIVGYGGQGTLSVLAGATMTSGDASGDTSGGMVIGFDSKVSGVATISGAGSSLSNNGVLGVGAYGDGTLKIAAGGQVTTNINQSLGYQGVYAGAVQGAKGIIDVTGAGSKLTIDTYAIVGSGGAGVLDVLDGGEVSIGALLTLKDYSALYAADAKGSTANIEVADATLTARGQVYVGVSGAATLAIGAGGSVTTGDSSGDTSSGFALGDLAGGKGTASVVGAKADLVNHGAFVVGSAGVGTLDISEGGLVTTDLSSNFTLDGADIGLSSGSSGNVTVQSTGSAFSVGTDLIVGDAGHGALVDTDNAFVDEGRQLVIGEQSKSNGTAEVEGGALLKTGGEIWDGDLAGSKGLLAISGVATIKGVKVRSELEYNAQLVVGYEGTGTLIVDEGALAANTGDLGFSGEIDVGLAKGGDGSVNVQGAGSELEGKSFNLGGLGKATATISQQGLVDVSGQALIQAHALITLAGGVLKATNTTFTGGGALSGYGEIESPTIDGGPITATGGTLVVDGAVGGAAKLSVDHSFDLQFDGAVGASAQLTFGAGGDQIGFEDPQAMAGEFESFAAGDSIALLDAQVVSHAFHQGSGVATLSLTLSDGELRNVQVRRKLCRERLLLRQ